MTFNRILPWAIFLTTLIGAVVAVLHFQSDQTQNQSIQHNQTLTVALFRTGFCTSANNIALGYRQPLPDEPQQHFVARIKGQKLTLHASRGFRCGELEHLHHFPKARKAALMEIRSLLEKNNPEPSHGSGGHKGGDSSSPGASSPGSSTGPGEGPSEPNQPGGDGGSPPTPAPTPTPTPTPNPTPTPEQPTLNDLVQGTCGQQHLVDCSVVPDLPTQLDPTIPKLP